MLQDISVVICAYTEQRWNELLNAVSSVQNQTLPATDIIVVIDGNASLYRKAKEHLQNAIVIENRFMKGLSGARNSGAAIARGQIIAFLDDDAVACPAWLEELRKCYLDERVVGVGGKLTPLWESTRPGWFPEEFNWVVGCTYRGMASDKTQVRNMIGANMSMRRDIWESVGGFREAFGCDKDSGAKQGTVKWLQHYAGDEETEFCIRVTRQMPGSIWLYNACAIVEHHVSKERMRWGYFIWRCYDEGLGKASLVKLHDSQLGLASERAYVFKVLPAGVLRGIIDAVVRGDITGLARAAAIIIGLLMAVIGYLVGTVVSRLRYSLAPATVLSIIIGFVWFYHLWKYMTVSSTYLKLLSLASVTVWLMLLMHCLKW